MSINHGVKGSFISHHCNHNVPAGLPQPAEGPHHGGALHRAPGHGHPHPGRAGAHGGRPPDAHTLDPQDHRGGGPHRAPASAHPPPHRSALQGPFLLFLLLHVLVFFPLSLLCLSIVSQGRVGFYGVPLKVDENSAYGLALNERISKLSIDNKVQDWTFQKREFWKVYRTEIVRIHD